MLPHARPRAPAAIEPHRPILRSRRSKPRHAPHGDKRHRPPPDLIIFADTQAEPESVYQAVTEDQAFAKEAGIPFHIATAGNLSDVLNLAPEVFIPAHTLNYRGDRGILRRQCTSRFKIEPIKRHLRAHGVKTARMLLGITTDESIRVKTSPVKWIQNVYPLIDLGWSRDDCVAYLESLGLAAVKSACVFCPYRNEHGWAKIRENPADWAAAIAYDEALRDSRPEAGQMFVHRDCVPLREARVPDLASTRLLFSDEGFGNECEGHCGV